MKLTHPVTENEKLVTGLRVVEHLTEEIEFHSNEIFIKTRHSIPQDVEDYLNMYGWVYDKERQGIYYRKEYV